MYVFRSGITGYIDMADVAVAAAHLYIVSGLEYVGMIIIVVFHMHEGGIRIGLRKTVPSFCQLIVNGIFQYLFCVFCKSFLIALQRMFRMSSAMLLFDMLRSHDPVQGIGYLCQIFKGKFLEDGEAVRQFFFFTVSIEALQTVHDPDPSFFPEFFCGLHPYEGHLVRIGFELGAINIKNVRIDGIVLFKIAVQIIEDLFDGHLEVIMDETMKSHMGRCLTIHDKLKTDVIAAKRGKLSQRDIAKSEKNTLEHIHTVIPMRISMREIEIF